MGKPSLVSCRCVAALHGLATTLTFAGVLAFAGVVGVFATAVTSAGIHALAGVLVGIGGIQLRAGVAGLTVTAGQKTRERSGGENAGGRSSGTKCAIHVHFLCKFWN
jgi:hypothetical protein